MGGSLFSRILLHVDLGTGTTLHISEYEKNPCRFYVRPLVNRREVVFVIRESLCYYTSFRTAKSRKHIHTHIRAQRVCACERAHTHTHTHASFPPIGSTSFYLRNSEPPPSPLLLSRLSFDPERWTPSDTRVLEHVYENNPGTLRTLHYINSGPRNGDKTHVILLKTSQSLNFRLGIDRY